MAITVTAAGSRITANAAAVATAMGSGTTTDEATALGAFLTAAADKPGLLIDILRLINDVDLTEAR